MQTSTPDQIRSTVYRYIMQLRHQPAVLALSRQPLPTLDRSKYASAAGVAQGAYVLGDAPGGAPEAILIATGSELGLAVEAHEQLVKDGVRSRVASMPSWDIFDHQPREYRDSVCRPTSRCAWRSSRPRASAGSATSAMPAASSA